MAAIGRKPQDTRQAEKGCRLEAPNTHSTQTRSYLAQLLSSLLELGQLRLQHLPTLAITGHHRSMMDSAAWTQNMLKESKTMHSLAPKTGSKMTLKFRYVMYLPQKLLLGLPSPFLPPLLTLVGFLLRGGPHMRSLISIDFPAPEMEPESAHVVVSAVSVP